ncbi:hypothetical protein HQO27_14950 [Rhodococcus fascians]|nr:hypothetical protein [Rhodococcus fascians]MBY4432068.1 hypothetical protein [Rhodococcus fascians]
MERERIFFSASRRRRPLRVLRGLLPLIGTGVLAGGAVQLGFVTGVRVDGHGGEVGAAVALIGVTCCVALLAWGWTGLCASPKALAAAISTGVLAFLTTALTISFVATPYDAIVCGHSSDFCGLGVLQVVPTVGAVVPWTVAGIPGLLLVLTDRRARRATNDQTVSPPPRWRSSR